jgi:hypothetical protein
VPAGGANAPQFQHSGVNFSQVINNMAMQQQQERDASPQERGPVQLLNQAAQYHDGDQQ